MDAGGGEFVDVGRGDVFAALVADVGVAHVIADDEENVWFGFLGGVGAGAKGEGGNRQGDGFFNWSHGDVRQWFGMGSYKQIVINR